MWPASLEAILGTLGLQIIIIEDYAATSRTLSRRVPVDLAQQRFVIDTNPGGVAGPIRVATFYPDEGGGFRAAELPDSEIDEHLQAIESAATALRKWRDEIQSGSAAEDAPEPPVPPQPEPPTTSKLGVVLRKLTDN
jgi:hypothetical protein